jgi:hypothetical protein
VKRTKRLDRFIFVFLAVLLVMVNAKLLSSSSAVAYLPGVATGQFIHYSASITATGNDTEIITQIQQVQGWENITVLNVSSANVNFQKIFYNATSNETSTMILNIESGLENGSISTPTNFFIAANLSETDSIYLGGAYHINQTVIAEYLGEQLEANYLILSLNQTNTYVYGYLVNATQTLQCYWERRTGILLDYLQESNFSRPDNAGGALVTNAQYRILALVAIPSIPVIPEFPSILILPILMIATLLAIAVYKEEKRRS